MSGKKISIFIFIDALGYEIAKGLDFMTDILPTKAKLRTVFGFSSACIPSILSGRLPSEHKHWNFFYYAPEKSPFKMLSVFSLLPGFIANRGRVRHVMSKWVGKRLNFSGYFQLYNVPFKYYHLFDTCEKADIFKPGGLNAGKSIVDFLVENKVPHVFTNWRTPEEERINQMLQAVRKGEVPFAFLYTASLDAVLHFNSRNSDLVKKKIDWYAGRFHEVHSAAVKSYDEVKMFLFSDHGMAEIHKTYDMIRDIELLGLKFGKDYVAMYDSTIGRFWFMNDDARKRITEALARIDCARVLSDEELKNLGVFFEDRQFGELMCLMNPGVLIVPSFMGEKPIFGMHGFHPDDKDSDALFMTNARPEPFPKSITDMYGLMRKAAEEWLQSEGVGRQRDA
jgi:predicted AlkP superfamily pyrophosphatase or phosphodiesterase